MNMRSGIFFGSCPGQPMGSCLTHLVGLANERVSTNSSDEVDLPNTVPGSSSMNFSKAPQVRPRVVCFKQLAGPPGKQNLVVFRH